MNLDKAFRKIKIGIFLLVLLFFASHLLFIFMVYSSKLIILGIFILREEGIRELKKFLLISSDLIGTVFCIICIIVMWGLIFWISDIWLKIEEFKKGEFVLKRDDFWGIIKWFRKYPLPFLFVMLGLTTIAISWWIWWHIWPKIAGIDLLRNLK